MGSPTLLSKSSQAPLVANLLFLMACSTLTKLSQARTVGGGMEAAQVNTAQTHACTRGSAVVVK